MSTPINRQDNQAGLGLLMAGPLDPSNVSVGAPRSAIYIRNVAPGGIYQKQDDGVTTNWTRVSPAIGTLYPGLRFVDSTIGSDTVNDGTEKLPYKTISRALQDFDGATAGAIVLGPGVYSEGSPIQWKNRVNLIGYSANATAIMDDIVYTSGAAEETVFLFENCLINPSKAILDFTNSVFASVSFAFGNYSVERLDTNPSAFIVVSNCGISNSDIRGIFIIQNAVVLGPMVVNPGAFTNVQSSNFIDPSAIFTLNGDCTLRTTGSFGAAGAYVNGIPDGPDTPNWQTDNASDFGFIGTVNKVVL